VSRHDTPPREATPPCIFCGHERTERLTPLDSPSVERLYECSHCRRRFAVKAASLVESNDKPPR